MSGFKAQIIFGNYEEIIAREKSSANVQLGELLVSNQDGLKFIYQVQDITYGAQISDLNLEKISGMALEDSKDIFLFEDSKRVYNLLKLKVLITVRDGIAIPCKEMPKIFSKLEEIKGEDLSFLSSQGLSFGNLRSGNNVLDAKIFLDTQKVLSHHILISGTTGKGKSQLMKNLLASVAKSNVCGMLVLDPHNEYYGINEDGLKCFDNVLYYTKSIVPSGQRSLVLNVSKLKPHHFDFLNFTEPQKQIMYTMYKNFKSDWIKQIFIVPADDQINELSLAVLRRNLKLLLSLRVINEGSSNAQFLFDGMFSENAGESTLSDICDFLEQKKLVLINTSNLTGSVELLVANMIANELFFRYKNKDSKDNTLVNIVLEEAPRVIGKEVLSRGNNIFGTIAREGRKFNIGLTAITQLPSLIPKEILANMNTKIIMGTDMHQERQALIDSASHDLRSYNRAIASLDRGEAIVSSNFSPFAIPIKVSLYKEERKKSQNLGFGGVNIN